MFVQERQQQILSLLSARGSVLVKELAPQFSVTEDCIRKDLARLEREGHLKRTYGGAVGMRKNPHVFEVHKRTGDPSLKASIVKKALKEIEDGDTIYLDLSSTNLFLLKELVRLERKVTVVSPMLGAIPAVAGTSLRFFSTGGRIARTGDMFLGTTALKTLSQFRFDKGFFGAVGMDLHSGAVYTYEPEDGDMKEIALGNCKKAFLIGESIKLHQDGNYRYASLSSFSAVLLDTVSPETKAIGQKKRILFL